MVVVINLVKEDDEIEEVPQNNVQSVHEPETHTFTKRKKLNQKQREKTAQTAQINLVSKEKVIDDSSSVVPTVTSEINRNKKHVFGPGESMITGISRRSQVQTVENVSQK